MAVTLNSFLALSTTGNSLKVNALVVLGTLSFHASVNIGFGKICLNKKTGVTKNWESLLGRHTGANNR